MNSVRLNPGMYRFSSPAEAVRAVCAELSVLPEESIPAAGAGGRVLAAPVVSDRDSPALDVSAMDGFAMRMADLAALASGDGLEAITGQEGRGEAGVGRPPPRMPGRGAAVRIVTGAPIPVGADAVVRREDVDQSGARVRLLIPPGDVKPGAFIRRRGENAPAGAAVVGPGGVVTAVVAGTLAGFGVQAVAVHRRVRVAVLTTGDEVVGPHENPEVWQIRDSNGPALASLLGARAWIDVLPRAHVRDDPDALTEALRGAVTHADAVILTGGVSMGHRDFVPEVIGSIGARTIFHRLPQRPGKPMLAAVVGGEGRPSRAILGLPGNPVSVMVTARRLAIPILAKMAGLVSPLAVPHRLIANPDGERIDLWWHRLVREQAEGPGTGAVEFIPGKGSGDMVAAAGSAGFVEIPPGECGSGPWPFFAWGH